MATATLPLVWKGREGRAYMPVAGASVRHGRIAAVRKVQAVGGSADPNAPLPDTPLALKLWTEGGEESLDQLQREIRTLSFASTSQRPIAPRVIDVIGSPSVLGVVLEWCPSNLEDWWSRTLREPDAFGRLMTVFAEVARQVDAWHQHAAGRGGLDSVHGDLKPRNVLLSAAGRWLISDFGVPPVDPPADSPWADSEVIADGCAFLAPELRFHARTELPLAVDVWSIGAMVFSLLRMRRSVIDGSVAPRDGAGSLRYAPARAEQVAQVYRSSPARFYELPLDPTAFPSPDRLPDADRSAIREALRGALGDDDDELEAQLTEAVLAVLDRTLCIAPQERFPDAETLAGALEDLARRWISLAAQQEERDNPSPTPGPAIEAILRERDVARARAVAMSAELMSLQDRMDVLQAALTAERERPPQVLAAAPAGQSIDHAMWILAAIGAVAMLQFGTLVGVAVLLLLGVVTG